VGGRKLVLSPDLERINALTPPPDVAGLIRAQHERQLVRRDYEAAFHEVDVLVTPAAPIPAPRLDADEMTFTLRCVPYTGAANLVGFPSTVVPAGMVNGLPIAVQIIAPLGGDAVALRVARALERAAPEHRVGTPPFGA